MTESKATTSVIGTEAEIDPHPGVTSEVDYEGELAVIVGVGGQVWGYTIVNDVTARDLQHAHRQWLLGKSLDTFCPMGPYAVTADEVPDIAALEVETKVNGERRQHASLKDLIFAVPELIATLSAGISLLPGDVLATAVQLDEPTWSSMGDVDPALARRIRERLFRELEDGRTLGSGAHFPELQFGRVLAGEGRRWLA